MTKEERKNQTMEIKARIAKMNNQDVLNMVTDINKRIVDLFNNGRISKEDKTRLHVSKSIKIEKKDFRAEKVINKGKKNEGIRQEAKREEGLSIYGCKDVDNALIAYVRQSYIIITETKEGDNLINTYTTRDYDKDTKATKMHDIDHSKAVQKYAKALHLDTCNLKNKIEDWKFRVVKKCLTVEQELIAFETKVEQLTA